MKKKILSYFIIILMLSFFSYSSTNTPHPVYKNIEKVLESDAYSYLTEKEKKFIMNYYNETGNILLTTKNKQENEPYFNPRYGNYLNLTDEQKENIGAIPVPVITETIIDENIPKAHYASKYNLSNISGYNYTSKIKDQKHTNICWAFASVEQAESYIMKKNNITYSSTSPEFSPRQLDYASAANSIRDYDNEYGVKIYDFDNEEEIDRNLNDGGTFLIPETLFAKGVSLFDESVFPFDELQDKKELADVINFENSNYELNSSYVFNDIGTYNSATNTFTGLAANSTTLANFKDIIKESIMQYGGVYIESQAPTYSCSSRDSASSAYLIRVDNGCVLDGGHAMQIIGWNDDYSYRYCKKNDGSGHTSQYNCTNGTIVEGKGAWILRNSWGTDNPTAYLAYDTYYEAIYVGTNFTNTEDRTWDNIYQKTVNVQRYMAYNTDDMTYTKKINTPEKIEKIKFHSFSQNGTFTISVDTPSHNYDVVATVQTPQKGYVTVDLSNQNIYLKDDTFTIHIQQATSTTDFFLPESVIVFTSNLDDEPIFETINDYNFGYFPAGYTLKIKANTKNMDSLQNISFTLKNKYGVDYTSALKETNYTKISTNYLNSVIKTNSLPQGYYDLYANYNNGTVESSHLIKLKLGSVPTITGTGSDYDPYQITTEDQLRLMSLYRDKSFVLNNDITITNNWVPIGTKENPFTGHFNGNGYTIKNLHVEPSYKDAGLFGYVKAPKDGLNIKNVRFEDASITGTDSSGILIGTLTGDEGYDWYDPYISINISQIYVLGGSSYSTTGSAGSIIGKIVPYHSQYKGRHHYHFERLFSTATIGGKNASGLIGEITGPTNTFEPTIIELYHIENLGITDIKTLTDNGITPVSNTHSSIFGKMDNYIEFTLAYYISSPLYIGFESTSLYGQTNNKQTMNITNGYNILDENVNIDTLRDPYSYNWPSFNEYWDLKEVDGIMRIAMLKGANPKYTNDFTTIENLIVGDSITYGDYLTEDIFKRIKIYNIEDPSIITTEEIKAPGSIQNVDLTITAANAGTQYITIISNYDGYRKTFVYHIKGPINVFNVTNGNTVRIEKEQTYKIETEILPVETDDNKTITWTSNNPSVASVDQNGLVTTYIRGNAIITGTLENGMSVEVSFKVTNPVLVEEISVSREKIYLAPNESKTITTLLYPPDEDVILTWNSVDGYIAEVDQNGTITANNIGTVRINTWASNGVSSYVDVEVVETPPTYIKGDDDFDGNVDLYDIIIALRKAFGYIPIDDDDYNIIDINEDHEITIDDVIEILRYAFGYTDTL